VVLAGDNAVVIGLAAARVPVKTAQESHLLGSGRGGSCGSPLAVVAVKLLAIIGLTLAGGILLPVGCWRMWRDISGDKHHDAPKVDAGASASAPYFRSWWPTFPCRWTMCLRCGGGSRSSRCPGHRLLMSVA